MERMMAMERIFQQGMLKEVLMEMSHIVHHHYIPKFSLLQCLALSLHRQIKYRGTAQTMVLTLCFHLAMFSQAAVYPRAIARVQAEDLFRADMMGDGFGR